MNLKAYNSYRTKDHVDTCLFGSTCKNRAEAKRYILNHGMLANVDYVVFKAKRYSIGQIYRNW